MEKTDERAKLIDIRAAQREDERLGAFGPAVLVLPVVVAGAGVLVAVGLFGFIVFRRCVVDSSRFSFPRFSAPLKSESKH
jgi:hypothetical protein